MSDEAMDVEFDTFCQDVNELASDGLVEKHPSNDKYRLTDKGIKVFNMLDALAATNIGVIASTPKLNEAILRAIEESDIFLREAEKCFHGAAILDNNRLHKKEHTILRVPADTHAEAVGLSFLQLQNTYPPQRGWTVTSLRLDDEPVFSPLYGDEYEYKDEDVSA